MDPLKRMAELEPTKKAFSLLEEFKAFAFKGNVIDLAVGVIIGAAFASIVKSVSDNLLTPLISAIFPGNQSYKEWSFALNGQEFHIGLLLGDFVNFLILSMVLFIFIVKFLGWIMRTRKEEAADPPPLTKEQELLTEIRDLLKSRAEASANPSATPCPPADLPA
jgi:large conductance mechanosensitive channel